MNFSPINDPEFEKYRKNEAAAAAAKRRKKTLIILGVVALIAAAVTALIVIAAMDIVPKIAERIVQNNQSSTAAATTETASGPSGGGETNDNTGAVVPGGNGQNTPSGEPQPPATTTETPEPTTAVPQPSMPTPTETPTPTPTPTPVKHTTTIFVDAGHGFLNKAGDAMDRGTGNAETAYGKKTKELYGKVYYESDLTVILAKKVKALLLDYGYEVIMSREDYVYESLVIGDRAKRAAATGADLLVSIHADASTNKTAHGARVFYNYTPSWKCFTASKNLATEIGTRIDAYNASTKTTKVWGDKEFDPDKPLAMLRGTGDIPSALVETLFLTNEQDAELAVSEEWQNHMAQAIADAIFECMPPQTTWI